MAGAAALPPVLPTCLPDLSCCCDFGRRPPMFDTLGDTLTVTRAVRSGGADQEALWAAVLTLSPRDFVSMMLQDLPPAARCVVTFFDEGAMIMAVKTADGARLLDGDLAPGGRALFLRRIGRDGHLDRDPLTRLVLRNLIRFARRQTVTSVEVYARRQDLALWLAAGFQPSAAAWNGRIRPMMLARLELLRHLTRERAELAMLAELTQGLNTDDALAAASVLAQESREFRRQPLADCVMAPDLSRVLTVPAALARDPGHLQGRWTVLLDLNIADRLERLRKYLSG